MKSRFITWIPSVTPWICMLVLGTMVLHLRIAFGEWPHISPGTSFPFGLRIHGSLFGIVFIAALVSCPFWIIAVCIPRFRLSGREHLLQMAVYFIGCAAVNFSPMYEPTGLANYLFYW